MNAGKIAVIRALMDGPKTRARLRIILGPSRGRGLAKAVQELAAAGYVYDAGATVRISDGPRAMTLREVAEKCNIGIILRGANEAVLSHVWPASTPAAVAERSGLSPSTVYRAVAELSACGAVRRNGTALSISEHMPALGRFAEMLRAEEEAGYDSDGAKAFRRVRGLALWKVPRGCRPRGKATGFSRFGDYGVQYRTVQDYQSEQEDEPGIEDVLVHAVCAAAHFASRQEMTVCAVFYAKNRARINLKEVRRKAADLGMGRAWADVEAYVGRASPSRRESFLPWNEFLEKASLYGAEVGRRGPGAVDGSLFEEIGAALKNPLTAYVIGGENMRIKGLKESTVDYDLVVKSEKAFKLLAHILEKIGYRTAMLRKNPDGGSAPLSGVFEHASKPTVDLFVKCVFDRIEVSGEMEKRSRRLAHQNLEVGLLSNEDVFLFKAAACREGDLDDMAALAGKDARDDKEGQEGCSLDWDIVWDEILRQNRAAGARERPAGGILDQLSHLAEARGIAVPFMAKLRRLAIDDSIGSVLRGGPVPVADMSALLRGGDISDRIVRSRVDALVAAGVLTKRRRGGRVSVGLSEGVAYASPGMPIGFDSLDAYLQWRFVLRSQGSLAEVGQFAADLELFGYGTIGQVDGIVMREVGRLAECEAGRNGSGAGGGEAPDAMNRVQAARFCMRQAGALPAGGAGGDADAPRHPAARAPAGGGGR